MSKTLRLSAALLAIATVTAGCAPRPFRYVDRTGEKWKLEVEEYPRVVAKTHQTYAPGAPETVVVYYREWRGGDVQRFGKEGDGTAPPDGLLILADLAVFRGPHPDHEDALSELRRLGADLGAHTLTEVHYTVIMGEKYIGGTELVGWIYEARAARRMKEMQ